MFKPTKQEIKEEMEAYNDDEAGLNPITRKEAEYNLLNSDKYHYKNEALEALNRIDELASITAQDNHEGEAEQLARDYETVFEFIKERY